MLASEFDQFFSNIQIGKTTVTKEFLALALQRKLNAPIADCKEIVDVIFEEMMKAFEEGRDLKLANFGTFEIRDKKARPGRNPKTMVEAVISARRVVSFSPAPHMRDSVEGLQA